jgi:hypothetical protein
VKLIIPTKPVLDQIMMVLFYVLLFCQHRGTHRHNACMLFIFKCIHMYIFLNTVPFLLSGSKSLWWYMDGDVQTYNLEILALGSGPLYMMSQLILLSLRFVIIEFWHFLLYQPHRTIGNSKKIVYIWKLRVLTVV